MLRQIERSPILNPSDFSDKVWTTLLFIMRGRDTPDEDKLYPFTSAEWETRFLPLFLFIPMEVKA